MREKNAYSSTREAVGISLGLYVIVGDQTYLVSFNLIANVVGDAFQSFELDRIGFNRGLFGKILIHLSKSAEALLKLFFCCPLQIAVGESKTHKTSFSEQMKYH